MSTRDVSGHADKLEACGPVPESRQGFYIVGVGASAGGLEALERMFKAVPEDSGMAYVIVQHLSPDFKSVMDELLARHTTMPVHRVTHGMEVEPNSLVDESSLERVFRLLQQRHKVDFNYYKPTTIGRRIERRIQLNHDGDLDEYVRRLEEDPSEVDQLYLDLLIGVTRFFRDHEAFDALRNEKHLVTFEELDTPSPASDVESEAIHLDEVSRNRVNDLEQELRYEPDEFPARHSAWLSLIHPEDRNRVTETSVPSQDQCYVQLHRDFEYRMRHKSGEYRWYRHRALVDQDESGKAISMTGSVGDIHDRKLGEVRNLEEIRRRDNFLAMLSHELRNPMGAVLNAVEHVTGVRERDASVSENQAAEKSTGLSQARDEVEAHRIIERQTRHMARLLDDLLDVARFGQGKIEFRNEVVDLCALADDVIETVGYEVNRKDQILSATICDGPVCIYADPARIRQTQVNLLSNASKYTPDGGSIWYDIEKEGSEAIITVRDSGEGIPSDLLGSIFDLFVQSENSLARSSGGMGVGLSLARMIVEAHGGRIGAESEGDEKGSTFWIRLPLTNKARKIQPPAPHFSFRGCKLLLVEDNDDARNMLAKSLRLQGLDVLDAGDGQAALELLKQHQPDVAVIDIGLPVMNGYELVREVRKLEELFDIMLIALTGYGRQTDRQEAMEAGFDAHLVKPLNPTELYSLISTRQAVKDAN